MKEPVIIGSMLFWSAPNTSCAPFSRRNDTPIAVISSESLGALRSGVYATFSTNTPRSVLTRTARAMATTGGSAKLAIA